MSTYNFTVDAALLRELGERLVGRPYMALAELIKNSFDADATSVEISFDGSSIVVSDDGHGMSEEDFVSRWMRIGTTRKAAARLSPRFGRPLTGSKGVGRLAVQVLGRETKVTSRALRDPASPSGGLTAPIEAAIDWSSAVRAQALTSVFVDVQMPTQLVAFPHGSAHGTIVKIDRLADPWTPSEFKLLAREIWALRPPFLEDAKNGMAITLSSTLEDVEESFAEQMSAVLDIWTARITGRLLPLGTNPPRIDSTLPPRLPTDDDNPQLSPASRGLRPDRFVRISVELRDATKRSVYYRIPSSTIDQVRFDVRVFTLQRRQPKGVSVGEAREYLSRYGGVSLFDAGFRLPYYGVDQDWLNSEKDHARRLAQSQLVPEALQVRRGLLDLPPNGRLFGTVQISTSHEAQMAEKFAGEFEPLSIQVTRDRLTDNAAYRQIRVIVRAGLDLYAMETARAGLANKKSKTGNSPRSTSGTLGALQAQVDEARGELSASTYRDLRSTVVEAIEEARAAEDSAAAYSNLLGALATAGSTTLAYEHEVSKQVAALENITEHLTALAHDLPPAEAVRVRSVVNEIEGWQQRISGIRAIFGPLLSSESRNAVARYNARGTVEKVVRDIEPLAQGIAVDTSGIPRDLRLPPTSLPAWTSIFQNILLNAYNAASTQTSPRISVMGNHSRGGGRLDFLDNGVGVVLDDAEALWLPFERRLQLPPEREAAGLGGMGLGLTIVRMIASNLGVSAHFVAPPASFSTDLRLEWNDDSHSQ